MFLCNPNLIICCWELYSHCSLRRTSMFEYYVSNMRGGICWILFPSQLCWHCTSFEYLSWMACFLETFLDLWWCRGSSFLGEEWYFNQTGEKKVMSQNILMALYLWPMDENLPSIHRLWSSAFAWNLMSRLRSYLINRILNNKNVKPWIGL